MSATRCCSRGLLVLFVATLCVAATRPVDDVHPITPAAPATAAPPSGRLPCKPGAAFDLTFSEVDAADGFVEVAFDIRPRFPLRDVTWELELWGNVLLVEGASRDRIDDGAAASGRLLLRVPADGTHKTAELVVRGTFDGAGRDGWQAEESVAAVRMLEWERPEAFLPRITTRDPETGLEVLAELVPSSWTPLQSGSGAVSLEPPLAAAAGGTFLVTGTFLYEDKAWAWKGWTGMTPLLPIRRADVTVLDDATGAVLGQGSTGQDGTFAVTCKSVGPVDLVARCETDTGLDTGFQRIRVTPFTNVDYVLQGPVFPGHDGVSGLDVGTATALMTKIAGKDGNAFNIFDMSVNAWEWLLGPEVQAGVTPPASGQPAVTNIWPNGPKTWAQPFGAWIGYDDCYDDSIILHELAHVAHAQYSKISAGTPHSFGDSDQDPRTSFMEGVATTFTGMMLANIGRRAMYVDSQGQAQVGGAFIRLNIETVAPYANDAQGCSDEAAVCCALFDILDDVSTPDATPGVDDDAFDGSLLVGGEAPMRAFWKLFTGDMAQAYRMTHNDTWDSWATVHADDPSTEVLRALCASYGQIFSEDAAEPDNIPARATLLPLGTAWSGPRTIFAPAPGQLAPGARDQDWFAHGLVKGSVVTFETRYPGGAADANTQADTLLRLLGPDGQFVGWDDNSGKGRNARLGPFTVPETGVWSVSIAAQAEGWPLPEEELYRRYGLYDYRAVASFENHLPHVTLGPLALPPTVGAGHKTRLHAEAQDADPGQTLQYVWRPLDGGTILGTGPDVTFEAPRVTEDRTVRVRFEARDDLGAVSPARIVTIRVEGAGGS